MGQEGEETVELESDSNKVDCGVRADRIIGNEGRGGWKRKGVLVLETGL